jgi:hypothetical protein
VHKPGRFLQDLLYQPLMSGARTSRLEFARQESQWRSDKTRAAQQPEAIEGCQERSLLVQDPTELRVRVDRCVGPRVTMLRKASDAHDSLAAVELVLAQPTLSSQLIDNLNASIQVRALLTDLFPLREVANIQRRAAKPMASGG